MAVEKAAAHGDTDVSLLQAHKSHTCCMLIYKEVRSKGKKGRKSIKRVFFSPLPTENMDFWDLILRLYCDQANLSAPLCVSCSETQVPLVWHLLPLQSLAKAHTNMSLISHLREYEAFNPQLLQDGSASHPRILVKRQFAASYVFPAHTWCIKLKEFKTSSRKFLFLNYESKENSKEHNFYSLSSKDQVFFYCCIELQLPAVPQQNWTCAACWNVNHYTAIWWTVNNLIGLEQMNINNELEKKNFLPGSWQISKDIKNIWNKQTQIPAFYIIPDWIAKNGGKRYFLKDNNGLVSRCKLICCHKGEVCTGGKEREVLH